LRKVIIFIALRAIGSISEEGQLGVLCRGRSRWPSSKRDGLPGMALQGWQTTENDGLPGMALQGWQTTENDGLPHVAWPG
jgi:hypothetical protein